MIASTSKGFSNNTEFPRLDTAGYTPFVDDDIPVFMFLIIPSVVGTVGNIHTLFVYGISEKFAKQQVRVFILWLSGIDLTACVACMPFEIIEIRYNYTFISEGACKFFRFLAYIVSLSSVGMLTAIAVERYSITAKHLPGKNAKPPLLVKIVPVIIVGVSVLVSIPSVVFYGLNNNGTDFGIVAGTDCGILPEYENLTMAGLYSGTVILLSTSLCLTCCISYGIILNIIIKHIRNEHNNTKSNEIKSQSTDDSTSETHQLSSQDGIQMSPLFNEDAKTSDSQEGGFSFLEKFPNPVTTERGVDNHSKNLNPGSKLAVVTNLAKPERVVSGRSKFIIKSNKYAHGMRLTVSLIAATAVSYLGYIIFVATILVIFTNPAVINISAGRIFLRAQYVNNAANPVVYCLINKTFRKECRELYANSYCGKKCMR